MACLAVMNNKRGYGGSSSEELQKMALLQSLLKRTEDDPPPGAPAGGVLYTNSSAQHMMRGIEAQQYSCISSSNLMLPFQSTADQTLEQQRDIDSMAFGYHGMANPQQQQLLVLPGMQQPADDIMFLSRQLMQQQQQLQLQQQQQRLLQTGGFGGVSLLGSSIGNSDFSSGTGTAFGGGGPIFGQSLGRNNSLPHSQQGEVLGIHLPPPSDTNLPSDVLVVADPLFQRRSGSFPMTLHRLLVDIEVAGGTHIAAYVAGGDAFLIRNPKAFEERIIRRYFPRMGSFGSFQRQLNLYDFKRVSQGPHRGAYTHPLFRRQLPQLSREMKRTKIKGLRNQFKKKNKATEN